MPKVIPDDVIDVLLEDIANNGDELNLCSQQPTTYLEAHTTYMLAQTALTLGDGNGDYSIADGDTSGRKLTVAQQDNVPISNGGTANYGVIVDTTAQEIKLITTSTPQILAAGGTVTIPAFKTEARDPV